MFGYVPVSSSRCTALSCYTRVRHVVRHPDTGVLLGLVSPLHTDFTGSFPTFMTSSKYIV